MSARSGELHVSRQAVHEALADALRRRIMLGDFPVGAQLPTERELALALGASRNTIREAVRQLATEGLVTTRRGRLGGTTVVAPAASAAARRKMSVRWRANIDYGYEYRLTIEPAAAALAASRATDPQRTELRRRAAAQPADLGAYHRADSELHILIAKMSGNPFLEDAVSRAREESFREINLLWLQAGDEAGVGAFADEHRAVCEAILRGEPQRAHDAMTAHLTHSRDQFAARMAAFDKPPAKPLPARSGRTSPGTRQTHDERARRP